MNAQITAMDYDTPTYAAATTGEQSADEKLTRRTRDTMNSSH